MRFSIFLLFLSLIILTACSNIDEPGNDDIPMMGNISYNLTWESNTTPQLPQAMIHDTQNRPYFYVAMKDGGVVVYSANNPMVIATISTANFDSLHAMNLTQQGNYLYVALGNFFGSSSRAGLAIVDVSNPESPLVTTFWASNNVVEGSAVVAVSGNYAYLGAMKEGVFVLDISDKLNITETSQFVPDVNFPVQSPNNIQHPNARGMAIANNTLYLCYDAGGIRVLDIADPANLNEIGRYINDGINKQQAYNNIHINGNIAYVATDFCGMEVLDISNPAVPTRLAWINPWACETNANTWFNSNGHVNQLAYDSASNLVFLSSGRSELIVVDVADPSNPELISTYGETDNDKGVWGMDLKDNKVYLLYIATLVPYSSTYSGIRCIEWVEN